MNAAAESGLESALTPDSTPEFWVGHCSHPMLWKALKPSGDEVLLASKPLIVTIQNPVIVMAEGKRILTPDERQSFWHLLLKQYPGLKTSKARKAHADEISYYWATIPFDIEEPFFVIEADSQRFILNLRNKDNKFTLFWIDVVGDPRTLKP